MTEELEKMRKLIYARIHKIHKKEPEYYCVPMWEEEVKALTKSMDDTVEFIKTICTDEELFIMSEVFEDVCAATHDKRFVDAVRERIKSIDPNGELLKMNIKEEVINELDIAEDWI